MGVQVFISYRRDRGREIARNIYERLSLVGYNTFFDYDSMRNGMFNSQIFSAIDQCSDFIFILTNNSLQRCNEKGDWVRIELEYAIQKAKNIILLAPEDFIGFPEQLPESIEKIRLINIIFLSSNYYNASIEKLLNALTPVQSLKKRLKFKIIIASLLLFIGVLFSLLLLFTNIFIENKHTNLLKDCTAQLYLMSYNDLNLKENNVFTSLILEQFHYNDSIDNDSKYIIYPVINNARQVDNRFVRVTRLEDDMLCPIYYHSPILRLKLHSQKGKTLVFNRCFLEVDSFAIDATNHFRFFLNNKDLILSNEGGLAWDTCTLYYSFLHKGESFTRYKEKLKLPYFNRSQTVPILQNSYEVLIGELHFDSNQTIAFKYEKNKDIDRHEVSKDINTLLPPKNISKKIQEITINFARKEQEIEIPEFNRSLVRGEIDDDFFIKITSEESYICRIRLRIEAIGESDKKYLYSNYLYIHFLKPKNGIRIF